MTPDAPFDPGLQPERTLLGWRRTALSLAVVGAVVVRFTADLIGAVAIVVGALAIIAAATAYALAGSRYRRAHAGLVASGWLATDGRPLIWLTAGVGVVALAALGYVIGIGVTRL